MKKEYMYAKLEIMFFETEMFLLFIVEMMKLLMPFKQF